VYWEGEGKAHHVLPPPPQCSIKPTGQLDEVEQYKYSSSYEPKMERAVFLCISRRSMASSIKDYRKESILRYTDLHTYKMLQCESRRPSEVGEKPAALKISFALTPIQLKKELDELITFCFLLIQIL
jgi:hypothetical protein